MSLLRSRTAVSPLRRDPGGRRTLVDLPAVDDLVAAERPEEPMHCLRPAAIAAAARAFVSGFPGETLYAVKCNPEPAVLRALWAGGVRRFDCASAAEVALVRSMFPKAGIHFMHPVKAAPAHPRGLDAATACATSCSTARRSWRRSSPRPAGRRGRRPRPDGAAGAAEGRARCTTCPASSARSRTAAAALLRAARPHAARLGVVLPCRLAVPGAAGLAPRRSRWRAR